MMKKRLTGLLLALSLVLALAGCGGQQQAPPAAQEAPQEAPAAEGGSYTPGTYTATGMGHEPGITVTVTVDESSITAVELDLSHETPTIGGVQAEALTAQILAAQSASIDGVSGATETSNGVKMALADCLKQAQGVSGEGKAGLKDGTYTTQAPGFGITGMMKCEVTIADNAITDIKVVEETDSATGEWFASAESLLIPRILDKQSLAVDAITGATTSSNGIRNCVAAAIDAAGGDSGEWYTEIEKKTDTVKLEDYDVIVVGMGGSGVLSYCAAAQEGASVFGIEAAGKVGGNSVCTYGPMAINSEYLKELYNDGEDYMDPDALYKVWLEYVESDEKADVIHEAVYQSGTALDYFVENFGFSFEGGILGSFVVPEWTKLWCIYTPDDGGASWNILGPNKTYQFVRALETANALNEKNQYMTELTATDLLFSDDGSVAGVKAQYYDGTTYEIYGKSVILATGGFLGNADMMKQYLGSTVNAMGDTVNQGAGILMGQSAGGATYMMGTLPMVHIAQVANLIRNDDLTPDQKATLSALALTTDRTMVTTEGRLWGNENQSGTEDEGLDVEIVFAPGYKYYVVYSQEDMDDIKNNGLSEAQAAATSQFLNQGGTPPAAGTPVADLDKILTVGEEYGDVIRAGSIAELARAIGCDAVTLSETLKGEDGTYYAVPCCSYAYGTVGGLDINADMNVLKEDGTPIANLFAVGQDSEGVCNLDGKAYTPWAGQAQSWTFVSGLIAGTNAAKLSQD